MLMIVFMKMKEVIGVMVEYAEVGLKKSYNFLLTIMEKMWMVTGELDLGLIIFPITNIIKVCFLDHWVFIVMVMRKVDIGIIS